MARSFNGALPSFLFLLSEEKKKLGFCSFVEFSNLAFLTFDLLFILLLFPARGVALEGTVP